MEPWQKPIIDLMMQMHERDERIVINFPYQRRKLLAKIHGATCDDEGCPHYSTPHSHKESE